MRLLHDLCELRTSPFQWNLRLLEALERWTGSTQSMAYVIPVGLDPGSINFSFLLNHNLADEWLDYLDLGDVTDQPHTPAVMQRLGSDFTVNRQQLVSDDVWNESPFVKKVAHPTGWDQFILSMRVVPTPGCIHCLSLSRPPGAERHDERAIGMVSLIHDELARLWRRPAAVRVDSLSKRLAETLAAMRRGLSRKETAREMGISVHTVHTYEKQLFAAFGVSGRGELLAKLSRSIAPTLPR